MIELARLQGIPVGDLRLYGLGDVHDSVNGILQRQKPLVSYSL